MADPLRILLHAPSAAALQRARRSALDVLKVRPDTQIEILADAEGAEAALVRHEEATDHLVVLCEASLRRSGLGPPEGRRTAPLAALLLVHRQAEGWTYIHA